jgi:hypothetical protein
VLAVRKHHYGCIHYRLGYRCPSVLCRRNMKALHPAVALRDHSGLLRVSRPLLHLLEIGGTLSRMQSRHQRSQAPLSRTAPALALPEAYTSARLVVSPNAAQTQLTSASGHGGHGTAPTSEAWVPEWAKEIKVRNAAAARSALMQ